MKQLNEIQISTLFDFTRSKYVRYIDVQHELVDHLATDIEIEMNTNPSLTFEKALQKVYAKFPISGFAKFVDESEKSMNRMWVKMILSQFSKFYCIPLFIVLATLTFVQYQLIIYFGVPMFYTLIILAIIIGYWSVWGLRSIIKTDGKNTDDKYLVVTIFKGWAMMFSLTPIFLGNMFDNPNWIRNDIGTMNIKVLLFAILISVSLIWSYMAYYRFPQLIKNILSQKYSHLKLKV